jgi:hypothetical protein
MQIRERSPRLVLRAACETLGAKVRAGILKNKGGASGAAPSSKSQN